MNFILVTIPIRSEPDNFPPVGSTALLDTLSRLGYNPKFYDIDALRPDFEQVVDFFRSEQPDILGISAVVSTAYHYTKKLTYAVKQVSPKTRIILGGCLAASGEVLLRKCPIDICVIGEGENVLINLVKYWKQFRDFDSSREDLKKIKGIAFIDSKNNFMFTGYEKQLLPKELPQPNYDLLAKFSDINCYIHDPLKIHGFMRDSRSYQSHRQGQKCCVVMAGKGCPLRCTFCHRWVKGYRSYPVDNIINTMKYLKEEYNVGFFLIGDESFGADPRMLDKFIDRVRPLDILFRIGGIRISTVYRNPEIVRKLKEVGCVEMIFGMESGSNKILTIMEKGYSRKQNLEVAKLLIRDGMNSIHQLVVGMPGENDKTIRETIECVKLATEDMDDCPIISANYFQALPGTPGYEFMRAHGLIGKTLDDEEAYLLEVSDVDAGSRAHYKNVTEECISKVFSWPHRIMVETTVHWYKHRNWEPSNEPADRAFHARKGSLKNSFTHIRHWLTTKRVYFRIISLLGEFYWMVVLFLIRINIYGLRKTFLFTLSINREEDRRSFIIEKPKSLRKIVTYPDPKGISVSEANMLPLRIGR